MTRAMTIGLAGFAAVLALAGPAAAADNAMKVCGAQYQAAKTGKTLPAGQTWPQFLAQCRAGIAKAAPAASPAGKAPVAAAATKPATSAPGKMAAPPRAVATPRAAAGQPSAAQLAARSRQKQCAQNYQADKAANKLAGQSWPKYYSACSARLKG